MIEFIFDTHELVFVLMVTLGVRVLDFLFNNFGFTFHLMKNLDTLLAIGMLIPS